VLVQSMVQVRSKLVTAEIAKDISKVCSLSFLAEWAQHIDKFTAEPSCRLCESLIP